MRLGTRSIRDPYAIDMESQTQRPLRITLVSFANKLDTLQVRAEFAKRVGIIPQDDDKSTALIAFSSAVHGAASGRSAKGSAKLLVSVDCYRVPLHYILNLLKYPLEEV